MRAAGNGPLERCVNYGTRVGEWLAVLPIVTQMLGLNFEQYGFHCGGTPKQPPDTG
jgi:hypothetical protein